MKKLLSILLLFVSFGALAQTYDTLPAGSKPYGNFYLGPDGNLVFGNVGLKYRVLGTKKRVDSLLALKLNVLNGDRTGGTDDGVTFFNGNVNNSPIGGSVPSTARFTSLTATTVANVPDLAGSDSSGKAANTKYVKQNFIKNIPNYNVEVQNAGIAISGQLYSGTHFLGSNSLMFDNARIRPVTGGGLELLNQATPPLLISSFETLIQGTAAQPIAKFDAYKNTRLYGHLTVDSSIINPKLNNPEADALTVKNNLGPATLNAYIDNNGSGATGWIFNPNGDPSIARQIRYQPSESGRFYTNHVSDGGGANKEIFAYLSDLTGLGGTYQLKSEKAQPNGYASLDGSGKVPVSQMPDALVGAVVYQGNYDASNNTPALPTATGNKGKYYVVSVGGTQQSLTFENGDWIISNGTIWQKVDNSTKVTSVNGMTGAVNVTTISGNAGSATNWGGAPAQFSSYTGGTPIWFAGLESESGVVVPWNVTQMRTFLGSPTGGETLQSVADRGNSYIAAEAYLSLTSNNPSGKRFDIHSSSVGDFRVTNATDNVLGLLIKANGNTGIKNDNPTEVLDVNGNGKFSGSVTANNGVVITNNKQLLLTNSTGQPRWGISSDPTNDQFKIESDQIFSLSLDRSSGNMGVAGSITSASLLGIGDRVIAADAAGVLKVANQNSFKWNGESLSTASKVSGDFAVYNGTNWINKAITATAPLSWNASTSNLSINLSAYQTTGNLSSVVSASTTNYPSNTAVINYNAANYAKQGGNSLGANMVIGTNDANDVKFIRNGFETLVLSNTATFNAPIAAPNLSSGTYTPTLTNITNSSSTTSLTAHYIRVGNEVTVTGRIGATSTAAGTMQIAISLPIASALTTTEDASGFGQSNSPITPLEIYYRTASSAVVLETVTTGTVGANYRYQFTYTVK